MMKSTHVLMKFDAWNTRGWSFSYSLQFSEARLINISWERGTQFPGHSRPTVDRILEEWSNVKCGGGGFSQGDVRVLDSRKTYGALQQLAPLSQKPQQLCIISGGKERAKKYMKFLKIF